jgi:hypothetical protein
VDWLRLQVEGRWLSPTTDTRYAVVNYVGPNDNGAFALNAGIAVEFTDLFAAIVNGGKEPPSEVNEDPTTTTTTTTEAGAQP